MESWQRTQTQFERYLRSSGRSANTAKTYSSNLLQFWRYCAHYECTPFEADRDMLRTYIADRLVNVSSQRAHNDLAALRLFYAWLLEAEYREDDPSARLKVKRTKALPTEPIDRGELVALLSACSNDRDRMMILVMASTGIRISELSALTAEDIDWSRGTLKIHGKGDKERLVTPPPEVLGQLHAFLGMFPEGPLWISSHGNVLAPQPIRNLLQRIGEKAKVEHVHPHRLRALFATEFIEQFKDIQALQSMMGHESIETTARYSEWTRDRRGQEMMRKLRLTG